MRQVDLSQAPTQHIADVIQLRPDSSTPLRQQIAQQIERLILDGTLARNQRLPTHRDLAALIGVHFRTVREAYLRLQAKGLVEQIRGSGTFVTRLNRSLAKAVVLMPPWAEFAPDWRNSVNHQEYVGGIELACRKHQVSVSILTIPSLQSEQEYHHWIDHIQAEYDGLFNIIDDHQSMIQQLAANDFPVVTYHNRFQYPGVTEVLFDRRHALQMGTEHLISLGYKRIGLLARRKDDRWAAAGFEGYFDALVRHQRVYDPTLTIRCDDFMKESAWEETLEEAVRCGRLGDAVVAETGWASLVLLRILKRHHIRVPEDVAIVGFDELMLASHCDPPLTWLCIPRHEIGVQAGRLMAERLLNNQENAGQYYLKAHLVPGRSCSVKSRGDGRITAPLSFLEQSFDSLPIVQEVIS